MKGGLIFKSKTDHSEARGIYMFLFGPPPPPKKKVWLLDGWEQSIIKSLRMNRKEKREKGNLGKDVMERSQKY